MNSAVLNFLLSLFRADSLNHLLKIWCAFAIAGSASLIVSQYIVAFFFDLENDEVLNLSAQVIVIIISYYLLLLLAGACLGEGPYFLQMTKKSLGRPLKFLKYLVGLKY